MEDRGSMPRIWAIIFAIQLLSSFASAQGPASAPAPAAPIVPPVAPATSPPAPPTVAPAPVGNAPALPLKFVPNATILSVGNTSYTGRTSLTALASPSGDYALVLILDGFGTEKTYQYCWTEVHNILGNLTFRENCRPLKVETCSLTLTSSGDLRLTLESRGAKLISWRTETENKGVVDVKLSDAGVLTLVDASDAVVWSSTDDKDRCLEPYDPNNSSKAVGFSKFVVIGTTLLGLILSISLC
ncbi:hypothetical protein MPTK1_4g04960 [Marchantia polymorpha subsp. ruderalis]|uniref:Bulb-type lectin domain-containing protein n=2 Tax=Marchantia polymorpha TaxID=3197 RepID=A0AAF6B6H4_MARPO|nr:hypothetical protein MARPO_0150s0020 [Marchantia polymorpha]BBN07608.1 hypothetical protein Mp_4g04960 [Marchantia polymorpha subsp. ruderalis]|eukprot:PTQ29000.1 hypothetical protein MARPO_0150s0020 [Marchantia polymorpha]